MFDFNTIVNNLLNGRVDEFLDLVMDGEICVTFPHGVNHQSGLEILCKFLEEGKVSLTCRSKSRTYYRGYGEDRILRETESLTLSWWIHHDREEDDDMLATSKWKWVNRLCRGEYTIYREDQFAEVLLMIQINRNGDHLSISGSWLNQQGTTLCNNLPVSHRRAQEVTSNDIPF